MSVINEYSVYLFIPEILHVHTREANESVPQYSCNYVILGTPSCKKNPPTFWSVKVGKYA